MVETLYVFPRLFIEILNEFRRDIKSLNRKNEKCIVVKSMIF